MHIDKRYATLHLPGRGKRHWGNVLEEYCKPVRVASDITVLTIAAYDRATIAKLPLMRQLQMSDVHYIDAAQRRDLTEWHKTDKLTLLADALRRVDTPYALLMDSNDTIILHDLDDDFIDRWLEFDCDVLFNGSEFIYPKMLLTTHIEESIYCQRYLNCGVCFGRADALLNLYDKAVEATTQDFWDKYDSEQYYIRIAIGHNKIPRIAIDNQSQIFLLSHGG